MTPNQQEMTANQQEMAPPPLKQQDEFDRLLQDVKKSKGTLTLESPTMDAEQLAKFLQALQAKNIHTLAIYNGNFGDQGMKTIAQFIKSNKTFKNLSLINTKSRCGDAEAVAFADALKINKTLKELDLSYSWAQEQGIGTKGKVAFGNALRVNRTLEVLVLEEHPPSLVGNLAIANALLDGNNILKRYGNEPDEGMHTIWRQTAQNRREAIALLNLTDPADRAKPQNSSSSTSTAVSSEPSAPMTFTAPMHTKRTPVTPVPFIGVSQTRFTLPVATDAKKVSLPAPAPAPAPAPQAPTKRSREVYEKPGKSHTSNRNNNQVIPNQRSAERPKKLRRSTQ